MVITGISARPVNNLVIKASGIACEQFVSLRVCNDSNKSVFNFVLSA